MKTIEELHRTMLASEIAPEHAQFTLECLLEDIQRLVKDKLTSKERLDIGRQLGKRLEDNSGVINCIVLLSAIGHPGSDPVFEKKKALVQKKRENEKKALAKEIADLRREFAQILRTQTGISKSVALQIVDAVEKNLFSSTLPVVNGIVVGPKGKMPCLGDGSPGHFIATRKRAAKAAPEAKAQAFKADKPEKANQGNTAEEIVGIFGRGGTLTAGAEKKAIAEGLMVRTMAGGSLMMSLTEKGLSLWEKSQGSP